MRRSSGGVRAPESLPFRSPGSEPGDRRMKRGFLVVLFILLTAAPVRASVSISDMGNQDASSKILKKVKAVRHATLTPGEADTLTKAIQKDRNDTQAWLQSSPTSYL